MLHRFLAFSQNIQPQQNRPKAIFLAYMVRTSASAFFTTNGDLAFVEQIAKEFPASGCLIEADLFLLCHPVTRRTGWHGAGNAGNALAVGWGQMRIVGENRQTVGRGDINAASHNHVTVAISIRGRAQTWCLIGHH